MHRCNEQIAIQNNHIIYKNRKCCVKSANCCTIIQDNYVRIDMTWQKTAHFTHSFAYIVVFRNRIAHLLNAPLFTVFELSEALRFFIFSENFFTHEKSIKCFLSAHQRWSFFFVRHTHACGIHFLPYSIHNFLNFSMSLVLMDEMNTKYNNHNKQITVYKIESELRFIK